MTMDRDTDLSGSLLACLPLPVRARIAPELQCVELQAGRVLQDAGATPSQLYFPRNGSVSMTYVTANGETGEIATIGNEGLVGLALLLGDGAPTGTRAVVQAPVYAYVMRADTALREFRGDAAFQAMVMRHVRWLLDQIVQMAICSRHHPIERQLGRWLLLGFDRSRDAPLYVTHEALSSLLGVRREGITEAARRLQDAGAISYSRGCIRLEHRTALEQRACECYERLHQSLARLRCSIPHGSAVASVLR